MRLVLGIAFAAGTLEGCNGADAAKSAPRVASEPAPCAALCERLSSCGSEEGLAGVAACTERCTGDDREAPAACRDSRVVYERCMAAQPCERVRERRDVAAMKRGPCGAEVTAVLACDPPPTAPSIDFQF